MDSDWNVGMTVCRSMHVTLHPCLWWHEMGSVAQEAYWRDGETPLGSLGPQDAFEMSFISSCLSHTASEGAQAMTHRASHQKRWDETKKAIKS